MKRKFQIQSCSGISDHIQLYAPEALSKVSFRNDLRSQERSPQPDCSFCSITTGGRRIVSSRYENSKEDRLCRVEKMKNIYKSVNLFKNNHNRSRALKKIVNKGKVNQNVSAFIQKMTRSLSTNSKDPFEGDERKQRNLLDLNGIAVPFYVQILQLGVSTINLFILLIIMTFGVAFYSAIDSNFIRFLELTSLLISVTNITFNFVCVVHINGRRVQTFRQIGKNYLRGEFGFDCICLAVLVMDLGLGNSDLRFIRLLFLVKLGDFKRNIEKLEYNFINSFYREHYWGIFHIILCNFMFAHMIAIILVLISELDPVNNWVLRANLQDRPWFEQYIWAYYWAITTMLSIGYGDIVVSSYKEAICMIFIETFSCIILAYTINSVGNLIKKLQSNHLEKNKNLKIFKEIVEKNELSCKIKEKVENYINQMAEIKTRFNYEDQIRLLADLPQDFRHGILKQCNSKLFINISVFKSMSQKIISQLAHKIHISIAHPEQIILTSAEIHQIRILKEGKVGYYACEDKFRQRYLMNQLAVDPGQGSQALALNFLTGTKPAFTISSLSYSVICSLSTDELCETLINFPADNQKFSYLRDKSKHILNEFQTVPCATCKTRHTKATCPKLHYMPLKQMVTLKFISRKKETSNNRRMKATRVKNVPTAYKSFVCLRNLRQENSSCRQSHEIRSITEAIFDYLLKINREELRMGSFLNRKEDFQIKIRQMSPKSLSELQNDEARESFGPVFLLANKILSADNEEPKLKKSFTLVSQLQAMMGLDCDSIQNYYYYFPESNASYLKRKFKRSVQKKINEFQSETVCL